MASIGIDCARAAAALARNAVECLPRGELERKLTAAAAEGRQLRVKLGIDPTAPDIHLGHLVVLRKLREFQDLGHRVVLIIGDYTARVGDPSGRSSTRPMLSAEEIATNAQTFREQALLVLEDDAQRLEVRFNGEWLDMRLTELLALARTATVAQILQREDFAGRYREGTPITVLELLYPLLQGYDSVAVRSDLELGGTDQTFNLLFARDVQRAYGQPEQAILTMPILTGTDGRQKMSKSLGNHIGITEPPTEIYGKTMSIPDEAVASFFDLVLGRPAPGGEPLTAKRELARSLVALLHGADQAAAATTHWDRVIVGGEAPVELEELEVRAANGTVHVPAVVGDAFGFSRSEARRLIDQGGVLLGARTLAAGEYDLPIESVDGAVLRVGRRRHVRLRAAR